MVRAARDGGWAGVIHPGSRAALACWGGLAVVASAPVDEFWHRAYGRDAVLWSPPHLLAVSGSAALLAGLVLGMPVGTTRARLGSALALGALLVPVMEYEADVPQFAAALYLPVVVLGVTLARPVAVAAVGGRWPLTGAALPYTAFRLLVVAGLAALGHRTLTVPPILLAAVAIDAMARAGRRWIDPVVVGVAVPTTYVAVLAVLPGARALRGSDVVIGVALSLAAALVGALPGGLLRRPGVAGGVVLAMATLALAIPAAAHDPGQGDLVGSVAFRVTVDGLALDVAADLPDRECPRESVAIVGRRGGRTIRVRARVLADCIAVGALSVDEPGRWFVYVEQGHLEGWVPVEAGGRRTVVGRSWTAVTSTDARRRRRERRSQLRASPSWSQRSHSSSPRPERRRRGHRAAYPALADRHIVAMGTFIQAFSPKSREIAAESVTRSREGLSCDSGSGRRWTQPGSLSAQALRSSPSAGGSTTATWWS